LTIRVEDFLASFQAPSCVCVASNAAIPGVSVLDMHGKNRALLCDWQRPPPIASDDDCRSCAGFRGRPSVVDPRGHAADTRLRPIEPPARLSCR